MDITLIIGASGALLILIAFVANETHKWKDTDLIYDAVNFIGSALLLVYAILLVSYPFIILNAIWAGVSLKDVIPGLRNKK